MILAQVVGTVVSSRKDASIEGFKLMAVQPLGADFTPSGAMFVAVDSVGAGVGETVLIVSGSSARYTEVTTGKPSDAAIIAIVDLVETATGRIYSKAGA
jgi:ethanolamine utilization protein EutN